MVWSFLWRFVLFTATLHFVLGYAAGHLIGALGAWGALVATRWVVFGVAVVLGAFIAYFGVQDLKVRRLK